MGSLNSYLFLARRFRNWLPLVQNLRRGGYTQGGPAIERLVFWSGRTVVHPPTRGGLSAMVLEVWHQNAYRLGEFYRPKPGDVVADVGAHVGLFTLKLLGEGRPARVVALEPSPENFPCLARNLQFAERRGLVQAYRLAIGSDFGPVGMMELPTNRSFDARTAPPGPATRAIADAVPLRFLFDLADADELAFLKMDAEGAEYAAFLAADDALLLRIQRLAMEYHDHLVPGTLALLRSRLASTHDVEVFPERGMGHGRLFATRKGLEQKCKRQESRLGSRAPS
jgi:FkbM family methyltransferase